MENIIFTERLMLKKFSHLDFQRYCNILIKRDVNRWLGTGKNKSEEDILEIMNSFEKHWREKDFGVFAISDKKTLELMGHCGLKVIEDSQEIELLYAIDPNFWKRGYATESCEAIINYAFHEKKMEYLVAVVYPDNKDSIRVLEKLGFIFHGFQTYSGLNLLRYTLSTKSIVFNRKEDL